MVVVNMMMMSIFYHSCFGDGVGGNDNGTDDDNTDR